MRLALLVTCLLAPTYRPSAHAHPESYPPMISGAQGPADLVLIYQGGVHRLAWTEQQLSGYVSYRDQGTGRESWLFDGFLFLEFNDGRGTRFVGQHKLRSATRSDWIWLSDRLFAPDVAIAALDKAIASAASRIGRPARRRKVYLGLPEPILHQKDWGDLDGRALDFDVPEDRLAAVRWYVDRTLRRWRASAPAHLDLQGFYWVAEDASESRHILPRVAEAVHRKKLELIWIPYWRSPRLIIWRTLGFDRAYLQPNFFFNRSIGEERLDEACATARTLGMGLEVEFDARAWTDPAYGARLPAYFDRFAAGGALGSAPLAWYEAGGAIERMTASDDPGVRKLYHQLATVVTARQATADALVSRKAARRR